MDRQFSSLWRIMTDLNPGNHRGCFLVIWSLILLSALASPAVGDDTLRVRVGVYNFAPLVFLDQDGNVQGLFVDVLDYVADRENWELVYVPGTWSECLQRLEDEEIDLLPSTEIYFSPVKIRLAAKKGAAEAGTYIFTDPKELRS